MNAETHDNRREVLEMYGNGIRVSEIALELNIAKNTVYKYLASLSAIPYIRRRRNKYIIAAYNANWPVDKICVKLHTSRATVYRILANHGITLRSTRCTRSPMNDALAVQMYLDGDTVTLIKQKLHIHNAHLYALLREYGVTLRRNPTGFP